MNSTAPVRRVAVAPSWIAQAVMNRGRILYVLLFGLAAVAGFAKILVFARILSPAEFGVVSLAVLVSTLCAYFAGAGILEGLACRVPVLLGRGEDTVALRSGALTAVVVLTLIAGVLVEAGCLVAVARFPHLVSLLWTGPFLVTTVVLSAVLCDLQFRARSIEYAAILLLKAVLAALLSLPLAPRWGGAGVLAAESATLLLCALLCRYCWARDLHWSSGFFRTSGPLVKMGVPFTLGSLLQNLATNLDRWAVQLAFGVAALGTYAFAMNFATAGLLLLNMLQLYAGPRILRTYGETRDRGQVLVQVRRLAIGAATVFCVAAGPVLLIFPYCIERWFPQYAGANALIGWVYLGTAATTMGFFDIVFRTFGDGRPLVWIQVVVALVVAGACVVSGWAGWPLAAYAVIFAAGRAAASTLGWFLVIRRSRSEGAASNPD